MFDFFGTQDDLSAGDKVFLAELTRARIQYGEEDLRYQQHYLRYLEHPTESNQSTLDDFFLKSLAPMKSKLNEEVVAGLLRAVDIEKLKQMLPMLVLLAKNNVNIPLMLAVLGISPELIERMMGHVAEFIKKGN